MTKNTDNNEGKNIAAVEQALTKTEVFIEKNQKMLMIIVGAVVLIIGGYLLFKRFYLQPKEIEAQEQMRYAERYFEQDSLNLALKGNAMFPGFLGIIEDYSMTKTANLAHYYAGICYLKLGDFQKAIDQLDSFDSDDQIIGPMAIGAKADAYMELGKTDQAIDLYLKAAKSKSNLFTSPTFYMKAAFAYEDTKKYDKALEIYEKIKVEFWGSAESRDIDKYIARVKELNGANK